MLGTPSSYQTVGAAGGYTYSVACGDAKAYAQSDDWTRPNYSNRFLGKVEGNSVASEYGGQAQASSSDQYQQVFQSDPSSTDPPTFQYQNTWTYDDDYTGEEASTFSRADGQVLQVWGHVKMSKDACSVSDVKLYVWS